MSFKDENNQSRLSVSGLVLKKFPEVWNYSVLASALLCIPCIAFVKYVRVSVSSFRFLANKELVKAFFHTWKAPFFCVAALLFAILFLVEFTAKFSLAEAVLTNGKTGFFTNIKNAFRQVFRSIRYFFGRRKNRTDKTKSSKGEKVRRDFIPFIQTVVAVPIVIFIAYIFLLFVPELLIMYWENNLPFGYHTPSLTELFISGFGGFYFSETDLSVLLYRVVSAVVLVFGNFLILVIAEAGICFIILTLLYTLGNGEKEPEIHGGKKISAGVMVLTVMIFLLACIFGLFYEDWFNGYSTQIVAHRSGGNAASENSLDGIEFAIDRGCYASEIDVRRTRDGVYVVNHDNTFERMNGETEKIWNLKWDEINTWIIPDTTGTNRVHRIYRLEEMLDAVEGREKLFIELKGSAADERAVDEIMQMVAERNEEEEVVLISFHPDAIEYAEEHYPETDTGVLIHGRPGQKFDYNCDMVLIEQGWAAYSMLLKIKGSQRQVGVWTVNDKLLLDHFLRSKVDYIITDEIDLVERVKKSQDERTDRERMRDLLKE